MNAFEGIFFKAMVHAVMGKFATLPAIIALRFVRDDLAEAIRANT
jgi:hypothetical protein